MINVIICDDDNLYRSKVVEIINKYFKGKKLDYKILEFQDYDNKFIEMLKDDVANKVFILDIETPTRSGIDIARLIRKIDVESPIIFLTGHEELGNIILSKVMNFVSFINKFDCVEEKINKSMDLALKILNKKQILKFADRGSIYTIEFNKILYITTDTVARKTIIVTAKREYKTNYTLSQMLDLLTNDFVKTHKSCIVNRSRVVKINKNQNSILFDNGLEIDMLSSKYKKEIDTLC